jgi:hypothetical protein
LQYNPLPRAPKAKLEPQSGLLLTTKRENTPAKDRMSAKAKVVAKAVTPAAKARTLAKARVAARLTSPRKNLENSIPLSSSFLR